MPEPAEAVSAESLISLITKMNADQQATFLEAVKEMKKPDPDEQAKRDAEKERKRVHREHAISMAKRAEADKLARQAGCSHARPDGKHNFRAQVNSDGHYRPFCSYCLLTLPPIKATDEQSRDGLAMEKWQNVTVEGLKRMALTSNPGFIPPVPAGLIADVSA